MAEQGEKIKSTKLTVKHRGKVGQRILHDFLNNQVTLNPGDEKEIEMWEPQAERMKEASKDPAVDLEVDGVEAEKEEREDQPEQLSRAEMEEKENENLRSGREAEAKDKQERVRRTRQQIAAETGVAADQSLSPHPPEPREVHGEATSRAHTERTSPRGKGR